ncbi:MAG: phosphatase PAP2 family protein [Lysobacter sp.]|nr:phosphatase PAP2 family protein [Lysobacter sp.]
MPTDPAWRRWNAEARDIVRRNRSDPLWASRTYAMVSVAQRDILRTSAVGDPGSALAAAASASAAAHVLARLYPHEVPRVSARLQAHLEALAARLDPVERERALALGLAAANRVVDERADDGATTLDVLVPPDRIDAWTSAEHYPPLRPTWGNVRPFLVTDFASHMPPPPPAPVSDEFRKALDYVRTARGGASAQADLIARRWDDGPGTVTPPGRWNRIAVELIDARALDEPEATNVLALLNMAMFDAGVLCWRSKFAYWLQRPPQVDAGIVPTFPLPNFPAYPSGHAAFSGAAAALLAHRFPEARPQLAQWAREAAHSRVVSGIHFPFDAQAGLEQGRSIASVVVARHGQNLAPPAAAVPSYSPTEVSP